MLNQQLFQLNEADINAFETDLMAPPKPNDQLNKLMQETTH
ncbi:type II toxin -antitoxin system TacA 1-like antitoxin [Thiomicrospira microaerophila]|nr:DUF1778 domain-containing protein [Thiomicrospira microaerophila]